jgi:glycosyltransferase involved in cell wall biosynthesis
MTPIVYAIPRAELGGAQRSLLLLLRGLDRSAFPPRVFLGEDGPLARSLEKLEVPFEIANASFKAPRAVVRFLRFASAERGAEPHESTSRARVLHLYGARTLALAARASGMKVIERVNLLRSPEAGGLVRSALLDRLLLTLCHFIVVPSMAMEAQLLARGVPPEKLRLIPNGVFLEPPTAPRDVLRERLGVAKDALLVLGIGRLARVKGFDILAEAFEAVKRERPDAQLVVAGEGPERRVLEGRVRLLGDREDVSDLLAAADIFVQPSRSEVLSNALLEAMLAGKACVATNVGGTGEAVTNEETGLLVENATDMARAILRLARDPDLRARLGERAGAVVKERRSLDAMARAHEALYREADA